MKQTDLNPAVWWRCVECDKVNFTKLIPAELSQEDREEIHEDWEGIDVTSLCVNPKRVRCRNCSARYEVGDA